MKPATLTACDKGNHSRCLIKTCTCNCHPPIEGQLIIPNG